MFRILAAAFIAIVASCTVTAVPAHEVMSGWHYPASCCSDRDCAGISPEAVAERAEGYLVTVAPGAHPMWPITKPAPLKVAVPHREAKASPDGRFHLCIDHTGKLLCFFAAIGGS